jgi:hypothetical protein
MCTVPSQRSENDTLNYHELYANHYVFLVCFSVAINIHLFILFIYEEKRWLSTMEPDN